MLPVHRYRHLARQRLPAGTTDLIGRPLAPRRGSIRPERRGGRTDRGRARVSLKTSSTLRRRVRDCGLGIVLREESIPTRDAVRGAYELLGLDPLHIANEGQFLAVVAPELADAALGPFKPCPAAKRRCCSARCGKS